MDCYQTEIFGRAALREYIAAFYTTPLFRLERFILSVTVLKPSTDFQARQLAEGAMETFAAWRVEYRSENELLMCDFIERTRSWLMTHPVSTIDGTRTRLYFGTAIVPKRNKKTGERSIGFGFRQLLGFHKIYSRLLLWSARAKIKLERSKAS